MIEIIIALVIILFVFRAIMLIVVMPFIFKSFYFAAFKQYVFSISAHFYVEGCHRSHFYFFQDCKNSVTFERVRNELTRISGNFLFAECFIRLCSHLDGNPSLRGLKNAPQSKLL